MKNKKIAYVTTYNANDINSWSGLGHNILIGLKKSGYRVSEIGSLEERYRLIYKTKELFYRRLLKKKYMKSRDKILLRSFSRQVINRLKMDKYDLIFSPGTLPVAFLETNSPIIVWTDATFSEMVDFYPGFSNLCSETIRDGNIAERMALKRCVSVIYSSDWAAEAAINKYEINRSRVKVVPFGANIETSLTESQLIQNLKTKDYSRCKLLFVGIDWERKGGQKAIDIASTLNNIGIETILNIVGSPSRSDFPKFVKNYGYISKYDCEGRKALEKLFLESHFLLLPTKADCTPVVISEAGLYGLPVLTSDIGGISTVLKSNKNGYKFDVNAGSEEYSKTICHIFRSPEKHIGLSLNAYNNYKKELSWEIARIRIQEIIDGVLQNSM